MCLAYTFSVSFKLTKLVSKFIGAPRLLGPALITKQHRYKLKEKQGHHKQKKG